MAEVKSKLNISNFIAVITLLASMGVFTFVQMSAEDKVDHLVGPSFVRMIQNDTSEVHRLMEQVMLDFAPKAVKRSLAIQVIEDMFDTLSEAGREDAVNNFKEMIAFVQPFQKAFKGIPADKLRTHFDYNEAIMSAKDDNVIGELRPCSVILYDPKTERPKLLTQCGGNPLPIAFGRPERNDGLCYKYEVYYVKRHGMDYVLTIISEIMLIKC